MVVVLVGALGWKLTSGGSSDEVAEAPTTTARREAPPTTPVPTSFPPPPPVEVPDGGFTAEQVAAEFGDAVFRVEVEGCETEGSGSGFAISPRHVVTNFHVTVIDTSPLLVDRDGREIQGRVVGMTQEPDVALVVVDEDLPSYLEWADAGSLAEGQPLVAMGYPLPATDFTVTSLGIASFEDDEGVRSGIRADGNIDRGNSGGPSLTTDGKVAGINTAVNINQGGASNGVFGGGLQVVPLIQTHDAVSAELAEFMGSNTTVEPDCSKALLSEAQTYGDNAQLDNLWDACDVGDPFACDALYSNAKAGSEYELFARTCGGRLPDGRGYCAQRYLGLPMNDSGLQLPDEPEG